MDQAPACDRAQHGGFVGGVGGWRAGPRIFQQLAERGILVNAVAPGWVLTERQKELWVTPEALAAHLSKQCLPDPIEPEDLTGLVLYLASEASRMMTSQTLILDGGFISS